MFTSPAIQNAKLSLPPAIAEIESTLFRRDISQSKDLNIMDLKDLLEQHFLSASNQLYATSLDKHIKKSILEDQSDDRLDLPGIDFPLLNPIPPSSPLPDRKRIIHPYPTAYLDEIFSVHQHDTIKILPYLLAAYYIHFSSNRVIKTSDLSPPDTLEDRIFGDWGNPPPLENYKRTVKNYCKNFSLSTILPSYYKRKDIQSRFSASPNISEANIAAYLNDAPFSILHYRSLLYTWVYAMCAFCCTCVPALSAHIDYVLSTNLFYAHTLAFETRWVESSRIALSDLFEYNHSRIFSSELSLGVQQQLRDMGLKEEDYVVAQNHTTADVYKSILNILSAMLHPNCYYLFKKADFLHLLVETGSSKQLSDYLNL